ncbi:GDSL-type esterase/lipase family protein [Nocardiopsis sp. YSL2]|uniref:GDSL-type esterase/lipase family protein n=1 Tax=Nocardiopsis sp. YSL2 TaxID=2939492 RepID=UPI0026F4548F|nr:GDSL-type esterase/lipase family protein [Nocardiopsis sp. YSL2]
MRIRWIAALTAAVVAMTGCGGDGDSADERTAAEPSYYLSLGDSLTVGVQPDENGRPETTADGYTDVLYRNLYDADSTLDHERMGCGGEDTTSFIEGGPAHCDEQYDGASQLEAAEEFLAENAGRVDLVTLTIGGNNFTGCVGDMENASGPSLDTACVEDGLERVDTEIPVIASRLRAAAGPDTQIIAMTYYNPFLAALLLEDGGTDGEEAEDAESSDGPEDAREDGDAEGADGSGEADDAEGADGSGEADDAEAGEPDLVEYATGVLEEMNESLRSSYAAQDIEVADVEATFDSTNFDVPADSDTGMPANVQSVCDLTWMCNTDRGPDIHTNRAGAQEIAATFEDLVQ